MDELQATFIKDKLFIWGVSSNPDEVFTPPSRLQQFCSKLFLIKNTHAMINKVEMPTVGKTIVVPPSMKLFYEQFTIEKTSAKTYPVCGIEIDEISIVKNYINQEKKQGISFGDSYEFFRMCLNFSFSLVSRQRFIPYYKNSQSRFIANLDNMEDYELFRELVKKAPSSIKPKFSDKLEDTVKEALEYFVSIIISASLAECNIGIIEETKTDEWLKGLLGKKMELSDSIKDGLSQWLLTKKVSHNPDYNLLFKLEEPVEGSSAWGVSFNLQSKKDPSLIIGLNELWQNPKKIPVQNIKMHLLADLGIAAKFSSIIEKALYKPQPHRVLLSEDCAIGFIANDSFLLKDAGFAVHIPKITHAKALQFKVKVRFKDSNKFVIKGAGTLGRALFDFDYSVAIGDVELTKEEFYQLSRSKEKLVKLNGKWVELNQNDISKIIDYFEKKKKLSIADTFLINSSNKTGCEIAEVIVPKRFEEKVGNILNFKGVKPTDAPATFSGCLRPYQKEGLSWMLMLRDIGFGGILADDMGLGKTIQSIAYLLSSSEKPALIICPTSVLGNWQREFQKFSPSLRICLHHGSKRLDKTKFMDYIKDKDVVISSYSIARNEEETFNKIEWGSILLDEAQNIKNPHAKQTISINKFLGKNRFCLTGTPVENRLSEFWSIMNFVNPGFLSDWETFRKNFAEQIELENDKEKTELLKKLISPFILRRLKSDRKIISDLPEKTEMKEYCSLTKEQASLYQAVVDDSLSKIESDEKEKRRALIMAALIKLKQICNHPSNYLKDSIGKLAERSGKITRLREIIEVILQNNEKCLIFTQYKEMGDLLKPDIENYFGTQVCFLHGGTDRKKREQMIDYFQSDDKDAPKIFVLSLKAGGFGINLTKANHVIHFDRWWNPAVENQATDRAFRIGQKKDVFVYKFITTGTVEEKIDEMIERKLNLSDSLLSRGEAAITELDNKQLRELFSLRKEHMGG